MSQSTTTATKPVGIDMLDKASELSLKLTAFLSHTYGESGEAFRNMNDETQDVYLWGCSEIADKLRDLIVRMCVVEA